MTKHCCDTEQQKHKPPFSLHPHRASRGNVKNRDNQTVATKPSQQVALIANL
jgi:hypothetical protein